MPETVLIPTITTLSISGNNISIKTQYNSIDSPSTISAFIASSVGILNSTSYIEGELVITVNNTTLANYYLDINGNLILITTDPGVYTIDSDGNLTYTI
ncbi:MAG TPA: hypothetical protein PKY56_06235 [Candidatus Kapabacteria bacterium]|nr:hypothetical protein [Candidatus Kapabacteria bacterium]